MTLCAQLHGLLCQQPNVTYPLFLLLKTWSSFQPGRFTRRGVQQCMRWVTRCR